MNEKHEPEQKSKQRDKVLSNAMLALLIAIIPVALFIASFFIKL